MLYKSTFIDFGLEQKGLVTDQVRLSQFWGVKRKGGSP